MKYRIKATHSYYAPTPDFERILDDGFKPLEFDTEAAALAQIERMDAREYHLGYGECSRPEYTVISA